MGCFIISTRVRTGLGFCQSLGIGIGPGLSSNPGRDPAGLVIPSQPQLGQDPAHAALGHPGPLGAIEGPTDKID